MHEFKINDYVIKKDTIQSIYNVFAITGKYNGKRCSYYYSIRNVVTNLPLSIADYKTSRWQKANNIIAKYPEYLI